MPLSHTLLHTIIRRVIFVRISKKFFLLREEASDANTDETYTLVQPIHGESHKEEFTETWDKKFAKFKQRPICKIREI